ncbi:MAG: amidase [Paracoccaceae bacterium]|jgi:amidase
MDRCFGILRAESFSAAFAAKPAEAPGAFGPDIADTLALAANLTFADRASGHAEQSRILRAWSAAPKDVDVAPTAPVTAFAWTTHNAGVVAGVPMDTWRRWLALIYRGMLALTTGSDGAGMPFGLQLRGRTGGAAALPRAGRAFGSLFAATPATAPAARGSGCAGAVLAGPHLHRHPSVSAWGSSRRPCPADHGLRGRRAPCGSSFPSSSRC